MIGFDQNVDENLMMCLNSCLTSTNRESFIKEWVSSCSSMLQSPDWHLAALQQADKQFFTVEKQ